MGLINQKNIFILHCNVKDIMKYFKYLIFLIVLRISGF